MASESAVSDTAPIMAAPEEEQHAPPSSTADSAPPGNVDGTLVLGKGASLTLRDDGLIVRDAAVAHRTQARFCGVPYGTPKSEHVVPFYNVLWAEAADDTLVIDYATVSKSHHVQLHNLTYSLQDASTIVPTTWVEELLARAYGPAQRRKRARVLVNPHAGPGGAEKIWENDVKPLFDAARMHLDITRTTFSGEAIDICEKLEIDAYDIVIPCSGDGLPYECFNGLGKRPDARRALQQVAIAHIPCGSGNALSCNVNGNPRAGPAALAIIKGVRTPMDLMSITQGDRRILSFLSQSFGIVAECDLGTEDMRWMGAARFNVGLIQRIFKKRTWPCEVAVKVAMADKKEIKAHYKREMAAADYTVRRQGDATKASTNGDSGPNGTESGEGLPPLKYGTVNDEVPSDWEIATHNDMGNFYCGNMGYMAPDANFFAGALPNDGYMDLIMNDGTISSLKYIDLMTSIEKGTFYDNPLITYRKVLAYRLTPKQEDGYISIDGERIPFEPFQVEIHQGLGTVLSKRGRYEVAGPPGWQDIEVDEVAKVNDHAPDSS